MDDQLKELFSKNLRKYLVFNEKSQADMAKHMHISSATASDWCNGKKIPRADKLQSLCTWLSCSLNDLMGYEAQQDYTNESIADPTMDIYQLLDYDGYLLMFLYSELSPAKKESFMNYLRFLLSNPRIEKLAFTPEEMEYLYKRNHGFYNSELATDNDIQEAAEFEKIIAHKQHAQERHKYLKQKNRLNFDKNAKGNRNGNI